MISSEVEIEADEFLDSCNATIRFEYLGTEVNENWDDNNKRDTYMVYIHTPRGQMKVKFWDSSYNTSKNENRQKLCKSRIIPEPYEVLSCLQTYFVGDMEDFMRDFGYEIKSEKDLTRFINTYNAVVKEYNDVCRCFTDEQIEKLREIQ